MSKLKNSEEFEGGLEKRKRRKKKSDKTHVKIPLRSLNDRKKSTKQGRILEGGEFFWLARIYTPEVPNNRNLNRRKSRQN